MKHIPDILIDYDVVCGILDFHLGGVIDDELYEKVLTEIDELPWYDGIKYGTDDGDDIYAMREHRYEVSE